MTIEEIKVLDMAGIEKRMSEIKVELDGDCDVDALTAEVDAIEKRKAELVESASKFAELRSKVASGAAVIEKPKKEITKMNDKEVRNSQEYIDAFAKYIKTGKDVELRKILTENATATTTAAIPVPEFVSETIQHAWDDMKILSRVTRTELKGNVKVGVETASSAAEIHAEGGADISEESLTLKIVTMVPETIKKWVTFSDETLDMDSRAFIDYVYSELAYRIFKKAEDMIVNDITTEADGLVVNVTPTGAVTDFINAVAALSDENTEQVIIMNKASYAYYKGLQLAAGYAIDVFDGMEVLFNNSLDVVNSTTLSAGDYAIVGDLKGVQANFPNGTDVSFKYDDLSLAEKDLVKVVGRLPMGHGVIGFHRLAKLSVTE